MPAPLPKLRYLRARLDFRPIPAMFLAMNVDMRFGLDAHGVK